MAELDACELLAQAGAGHRPSIGATHTPGGQKQAPVPFLSTSRKMPIEAHTTEVLDARKLVRILVS
jgi:hypothetical protein